MCKWNFYHRRKRARRRKCKWLSLQLDRSTHRIPTFSTYGMGTRSRKGPFVYSVTGECFDRSLWIPAIAIDIPTRKLNRVALVYLFTSQVRKVRWTRWRPRSCAIICPWRCSRSRARRHSKNSDRAFLVFNLRGNTTQRTFNSNIQTT
jgi:hypothetical protein